MTRLLIVRHGQTVWNTQHRMQGQQNSPLTDTGRELARRLALRLRGVPLDGILTSPLGRAVDTARILAGGADVRVEERLRELDLGRWEGEDMRTMEERYPIDFESFWQNPNRYMELRGGETYDSLLARTGELLREMAGREGTYLMVTHAIALRAIRQHVLALRTEESRVAMPSCCLCQVNMEGGRSEMVLFGDRYHHDPSICQWWHGSPERIDVLRPGSTITRIRPLAEAFAHKPKLLSIDDGGAIWHDGARAGYLYRVAEEVGAGDVWQHPRTTMPLSYEFVTGRELRLELVDSIPANARPQPIADDPELTLNI